MDWNKLYFNYLVDKVCTRGEAAKYAELLSFLHSSSFIYSLPMDDNRAADGVELRTDFILKQKSSPHEILREIDRLPCSVLEMMVALAVRIECEIMNDDFLGDRTGLWFWAMVNSIDLNRINKDFDSSEARRHLDICLNREYDYEGHGAFFTVHNPPADMRQTDIWYQANWWLTYEFDCLRD